MIFPRGVYEVWLCGPSGRRLRLLSGWQSLTYSRTHPVSNPGSFTLNCGSEVDDLADIASLVEIWRAPSAGLSPRHEGTYILEKFTASAGGRRTLGGDHVNKLLKFRIVDAAKGSLQADKSGPVDNLIRAYVREQLTALATDPARDFGQWFGFRVEPDRSQGPTVTKEASRAYVLDTAQGLIKAAAEHETTPAWVTFEVATLDFDLRFALELRVWTDYRNLNRGLASFSPLVLSMDNGLVKVERERDHSREFTRALSGGAGAFAGRTYVTVRDQTREALAPWWRREAWVDGGQDADPAVLTEKGQRKLREGRPVDKFKATLRPHPSVAYGINLDLGDRVVVDFLRLWEVRIESVTITADGQRETVDLKLEIVE